MRIAKAGVDRHESRNGEGETFLVDSLNSSPTGSGFQLDHRKTVKAEGELMLRGFVPKTEAGIDHVTTGW